MTDKQQEVRDFLEMVVKEKGLSLNSLSLQLGKNPTYLFHFVKRHSPRRLDEHTRRKLSQILSVPEQKLSDYPLNGGIIQDKLSTLSGLLGLGREKDNFYNIEVVNMNEYSKGSFNNKNNRSGVEYLSKEMADMYGFANPENLRIINNVGDAMMPYISSNDMIWIDTSLNTPTTDGIYLINVKGNILLRRLQVNPMDNTIDITSDNPIYKTFTVKNLNNIEICGKAVMVTRKI